MKKYGTVFQPARTKNRKWNLVKTLLQTMVFWSVFLFILPQMILKIEEILEIPYFLPWPFTGWLLFIVFGTIGISSGATMSWAGDGTPLPTDCPNKLVIKGPYKYLRNPMAFAGIGQGICVGLILGSFSTIAYSLIGAVLWHFFVRPVEENDLENRFGKSFLEYKKNTNCWIPKIKPQ